MSIFIRNLSTLRISCWCGEMDTRADFFFFMLYWGEFSTLPSGRFNSSITQCAEWWKYSGHLNHIRKKRNCFSYFWFWISCKSQGCIEKTRWPFFLSLGSPSGTYHQMEVVSFATATKINCMLLWKCYLFPKCHFHREVLLQAAEMLFSALLPCFSLPTIYLDNYYLSGIDLLLGGNCTINFKGWLDCAFNEGTLWSLSVSWKLTPKQPKSCNKKKKEK